MAGTQVRKFLILLRELQKIHPEFPLQYAICMAEIAGSEGISLTALAEKTGIPLSTVSRIVGALSRSRSREAYGMLRVDVAADERRRKELYLTARGRAVMNSIAEILS